MTTTGLETAQRLHRRGVAANDTGHPSAAARHLRAALREIDAPDGTDDPDALAQLRTRVLLSLALPTFERDGAQQALAIVARATAAAAGDRALAAMCRSQRAIVLIHSGRGAEAITELDGAVETLDALPSRDACAVLLNRGVARAHQGDLAGADDDLRRAEDIARGAGLDVQAYMALHNRGWIAYLRGDLPGALAAMQGADDSDVAVSRGVPLLDLGRVLLEAGLIDDAADALGRACARSEDDRQGQALAEARLELATARWHHGQLEDAVALARAARDRFRRRDAHAWAARCRLLILRCMLDDGRRPARVPAAAGRVADDAGDRGDLTTARRARVLQAEALATLGRLDEARAALAAADALSDPVPPALTQRLELTRVRSLIAAADGDHDDARRLLRMAADDLLAASAVASTLELRTARTVHGQALAAIDLRLAERRGAADLLATAERWRAMSSRLPPVDVAASAQLAEVLSTLRQRREDVRGGELTDEGAAELTALEQRATRLARASGPAAPVRLAQAVVDHDALLSALDAHDADLVTTVVRGGRIDAIAVTGGRAVWRCLGDAAEVHELARRVRADVAALGHAVGEPLRAAVRRSRDTGIAELRRRVLDVFDLHAGRLVVVPHAGLLGVPWTLVAGGRAVVVAPSATMWCRRAGTDARPDRDRSPRVAVLRGPRMGAAESAAVLHAWGETDATEPALADVAHARATLADDVDVVHVAAHGTHVPDNAMFSRVDLRDGSLCVYDLEHTGVGAAHVVLAACDVGRAVVRPGDEALGLATGILALGATSVVAPVCAVSDDAVAPVMRGYHRALAAGVPADVALADAVARSPDAAGAFVLAGAAWTRPEPRVARRSGA